MPRWQFYKPRVDASFMVMKKIPRLLKTTVNHPLNDEPPNVKIEPDNLKTIIDMPEDVETRILKDPRRQSRLTI
jgi:hypothetical protein